MTTSPETDWMDHPKLRRLVEETNELTLEERLTLIKGIVPGIAAQMSPNEFFRFADEFRLKGARYHDAAQHPGEGRASRSVIGERDLENR